jgi:hypothetical protein
MVSTGHGHWNCKVRGQPWMSTCLPSTGPATVGDKGVQEREEVRGKHGGLEVKD